MVDIRFCLRDQIFIAEDGDDTEGRCAVDCGKGPQEAPVFFMSAGVAGFPFFPFSGACLCLPADLFVRLFVCCVLYGSDGAVSSDAGGILCFFPGRYGRTFFCLLICIRSFFRQSCLIFRQDCLFIL